MKVLDCLLASQCSFDGKKGLKGTFWNNREMTGKPVTTQYYTTPLAVTTAGMHNFAPGVQLEDFSAKYETVFTPSEAGEYVVNVDACGQFELYIDGERKFLANLGIFIFDDGAVKIYCYCHFLILSSFLLP